MFLFVRMSHKRSHRWTNYVLMISSCDDCLFAIISHLMSPYKILQIQDPECNFANLQAWQKHAKAICLLSIWHGTSCSGKWQPWPCPGKTWKLIYCALAPWYRHLPTTVWHYNICSSETLRSTSRSRQEPLSLAKVATAETTLIHIILSLILSTLHCRNTVLLQELPGFCNLPQAFRNANPRFRETGVSTARKLPRCKSPGGNNQKNTTLSWKRRHWKHVPYSTATL